ncbi:hypothetical protein [Tenacibaculum crassostreae]|uniref:hypothetical protein n=1 Tax=Tenacibaculum crassostreae TaxID=502683 RepID=UPI00389477A8
MNSFNNKQLLTIALLFLSMIACKQHQKNKEQINTKPTQNQAIEITTRSMEFIAPDTISSGWNTFKYHNLSNETHFFLLDKYPEGKTIKNTQEEIIPPFEKGMRLINEGNSKEGFEAFNALPEWFFSVVFSGGSGLIGPRSTSITTIKLDPGYYIMECYVKMPNGMFHTSMGMAKPIIVTNEDSGNSPPIADVGITISKEEGIKYSGNLVTGEHIFSVYFKDQSPHEHFIGHDVNLVKLSNNADLNQLESWMNWSTPFGLKTPVPNGVAFLGGVNESPKGSTGYFKATLSSGKYAFISEVPNSQSKRMLKVFTVK